MKPTLVFLHGFNGNSKSWYFQFKHFYKHRVISIDAPGFGRTSIFNGGMAGFAHELNLLLTTLKVHSFVLIGHSMGGMLAQILAAKNSLDCVGVVFSCTHKGRGMPAGDPLAEEFQQRIEQRLSMNDEEYGEFRVNRMLSGRLPTNIHNFLVSIAGDIRVEGIKWGGAAMQYLDTTRYLEKIKIPSLILSAKNDIVVKPKLLKALIANLPNALHIEMANVGHAPYCENAGNFNQIIEQFIINKTKK